MLKRSNNEDDLINSSKKLNYNMWKEEETNQTPPQTLSINKYNFNIWNKSMDESDSEPIKISDLKIGICTKRPLIFRVSFKSEKRESKNGPMFVLYAMDSNSEIQVTVFAKQTDNFFHIIQFNGTYELMNFNVKKQNENFPLFIGEGLFLSLLASSTINEIKDDQVPALHFNFLSVKEIQLLGVNSKCDCIAVIAKNWGQQIVGQNKLKRELSLTDKSKECIVLTLWGASYEQFDQNGSCILIHNGVINEYNDVKTISCTPNTLFWPEPDIPMANELKIWFDKELKKMNK